jgi:Ca2+/Na+ antiporter
MAGHGVPHHAEKESHKQIGIVIAVIAVVMAIITALANQQANTVIVKEVQASNGFAWYQAKRQRSYLNELELKRIDVELAGAPTDAQRKLLEDQKAKLKAKNAEYEGENKDILSKAEADKKSAELAAHKHHWLEYSEILLHIAVVLCSLTLLTDQQLFSRLGIGATVVGLLLAAMAWKEKPHADPKPAPAAATNAPSAK